MGTGNPPGRPRKTPINGHAAPSPAPVLPPVVEAGRRDASYQRLCDMLLGSPSSYRPTLDVMRVPGDGNDDGAAWVGMLPASELTDARQALAKAYGAGMWRLDLRDVRTGKFVAKCNINVDVDLRPARTSSPAAPAAIVATSSDDVAALRQELAALRQELAALRAPAVPAPSPTDQLRELIGMAREVVHPAPVAAAAVPDSLNPESLVKFGVALGKEIVSEKGGVVEGGVIARLAEESLPRILSLGDKGIEMVFAAIAERKAAREAAREARDRKGTTE